MRNEAVLTLEQAREELDRRGISVASFARQHNLHPRLVCAVLSGRLKCRIGESHRAAVLLGVKDGEIVNG
ncbi:MAG: hypothetical protein HKUEN07_12820 [Rhodocyclaceae bacterium]|jgi:gp16 family phage-associated protein|nr:DNA-binding protein [Rhodocyclaceae bacterium]MCZ2113691.1 DNA-binding protein [Anaerolineae bacterium]OQY71435.1 MAG: DNA-binding protein [Rhodocyclaceae bacterium UTPRO2]GIK44469.1 MAG: hypothetical protein BroJett012_03720 [Betaproteobacteria bacterium]MCL4723938.1 DNA-binding protein [Rhodocyclaceae bacterium]